MALAQELRRLHQQAGFINGVHLTSEWPDGLPDGWQHDWFYFGSQSHQLQPNGSLYRKSAWLNNKNDFLRWAWGECRAPRPPTRFISSSAYSLPGFPDRQVTQYIHDPFPIVVKAAVSAGALDVVRVDDMEELLSVLKSPQFWGRDLQLQEYLPEASFYSLQVANGDHLVVRQVIGERGQYVGADPLPMDDPRARHILAKTRRVGQQLKREGLPVFSLDVAVLPAETVESERVLLLECNPRYGGTTYPWLLAKRLGIKVTDWDYRYHPLPRGCNPFTLLEPYLHTVGLAAGLILVDLDPDHGEVGILYIGKPRVRENLRRLLTYYLR
jgi:hypothetical protein